MKKAVLSTTAKAVARAKIAAKAKEGDEMEMVSFLFRSFLYLFCWDVN